MLGTLVAPIHLWLCRTPVRRQVVGSVRITMATNVPTHFYGAT
jgi:hypothetical protein